MRASLGAGRLRRRCSLGSREDGESAESGESGEYSMEGKMKLTRTMNVIVQVLAVALQIANYLLPVVPASTKPTVSAIAGIIQLIVGVAAHGLNPDGSSASLPYRKP